VVWAARYEVWGKAQVLINEVENPLRLQGQYEDGETGLHYNRHRYCDPVAGQFISLDPLGLAAGENLSNYAPNTAEWTDPLGLWGAGAATPRYRHGPNGELRRAFAQIRPQDLNTGTRTNGSSRARAKALGCQYDEAGHPIGFQLGGKGGVDEIFSQNRGINRGQFAQFESSIAAQVRAGHTVFVRITPQYMTGSTRPYAVAYSVRVNGQTTMTRFANPPRFPNCVCPGTH
jgi:RHS repeat-associated protein